MRHLRTESPVRSVTSEPQDRATPDSSCGKNKHVESEEDKPEEHASHPRARKRLNISVVLKIFQEFLSWLSGNEPDVSMRTGVRSLAQLWCRPAAAAPL